MQRSTRLTLALAVLALAVAPSAEAARVCWPGVKLPAVYLPAVHLPGTTLPAATLPATTLPGGCVGGYCYPSRHIPAVTIPAVTIPAVTIPATTIPAVTIPAKCYSGAYDLAPRQTTVRATNYRALDRSFSPQLSSQYWRRAGRSVSVPNTFASGYGELNAAGFPKNQYVRGYVRRDGTYVRPYWRNSPTDGLPTCRFIRC